MERREIEREKNYVLVEYRFSKDEVEEAENGAARYLNSKLEIPGFRKGRVPKSVLKLRLGRDFDYYVLDELLERAVKKDAPEDLLLVPKVVEEKLEKDGATLRIEYHTEPDVELPDPESAILKIAKKESVLKNYVEKRLESLREEHALLEPKDGPAGFGDMVRVRMRVETNGRVIRDEEYEYVLVEGDTRPFVQEIVGKRAGDTVEFDREYKGTTFHYTVEIIEVYSRSLMELDDEFAKTVSGEFETLEKLKERLKEEGEEIYEVEKKSALRNQALEWLVENSELVISDRTLETMVEGALGKLKEDGKYDEYVEKFEGEEKLRESLRKHYEDQLKEEYTIRRFAEKSGIEVSEEELMEEAEALSQLWGISPQRARVLVRKDGELREELWWTLLKNKVADSIIEKARIEEIEVEEGEDEEG